MTIFSRRIILHRLILLMIFGLTIFLTTPVVAEEQRETFTDAPSFSKQWKRNNDAAWTMAKDAEESFCRGTIQGKSTYMIRKTPIEKPDMVLDVKIRVTSESTNAGSGAGITLSSDQTLSKGFVVTVRTDGKITLKDLQSNKILGVQKLSGEAGAPERWHALQLQISKDRMVVMFDQQEVLSLTLTLEYPVYPGFLVIDAIGEFDDLQIADAPKSAKVTATQTNNIASLCRVSSNTPEIPGYPPAQVVDGSPQSMWQTGNNQAVLELQSESSLAITGLALLFPQQPELIAESGRIELRINGVWKEQWRFAGNKEGRLRRDFPAPVTADAIRYVCEKSPSYTRALSEIKVFSEQTPAPAQRETDLSALAYVWTSHRRYKGGEVSRVTDGDPSTVWLAGPYAHLFLRYDRPVELTRIEVDYGSVAARCTDYLLQIRQGELWKDAFLISQNDESRRTHLLPRGTFASGVRWVPLATAQASDTRMAEIRIFGYGNAQPWKPDPAQWATVTQQRSLTRKTAFGLYAVDHWRDFFPAPSSAGVDGVEYYMLWKDLEPEEGKFDWSAIDEVLYECGNHGQKVILKVMACSYCPEWIFNKGVPRVLSGDQRVLAKPDMDPPQYWNPSYLELLNKMVRKLAERYDGNEVLDSVIMTLAGTGEMGRFGSLPHAVWEQAGYSDATFSEAMNHIVDFYADAFKYTPVTVQISYIASSGSATPALLVAQHAATRGVVVEQATLDDFMGCSRDKHPSVEGDISYLDIYARVRGKTVLSGEANAGFSYNQSSDYPARFPEVLWQSYLNGLGAGFTHLAFYPADLYHPKARELNRFVRQHLGKTVEELPSVWIGLRGYPLINPAQGITLIEEEGGHTVAPAELVGKRLCRKIQLASGQDHMTFSVAKEFVQKEPRGLKVRVVYWDQGSGGFSLSYRTSDNQQHDAELIDRWENPCGATLQKAGNTEAWKEAFFHIPPIDSAAELSLKITAHDNKDLSIHFVEAAGKYTSMHPILPQRP